MQIAFFCLLLLSAFGLSGCVTADATRGKDLRVREKKQFWITAIYEDSAIWTYDENTTFGRKFVLGGYFDGAREKAVFLVLDYANLKQPERLVAADALRDIEKGRVNVTILDTLPQDYTLVASRSESQDNGVEVKLPPGRVSMKYVGTLLWSVPLDIVTSPVQAGVTVFGEENMKAAGLLVVKLPLYFLIILCGGSGNSFP
jgi:hypothetical protein